MLQLEHDGGLKAFLNGQEIYKGEKPTPRWNPRNDFNVCDHRRFDQETRVPRVEAVFKPGWNRLLLKALDGSHATVQWGEREDIPYRTKNIRWVTRLPDWGTGSPIVVKDRVFVGCEPDLLVCLDKKTGQRLWTRHVPIAAAVTEEDRKAHPELAKLDPLLKDLEAEGATVANGVKARKAMQAILDAADKDRFAWPKSKGLPASGYSFPTPTSDGEHVYVFFANSIAACFDLEGRRIWIRNLIPEIATVENGLHGPNGSFNMSAPLLLGDKLILLRDYLCALDKRTGELLWKAPPLLEKYVDKSHDRKELKERYNTNFSTSPAACRFGGEDLIVCASFAVVRASDGELLCLGDKLVPRTNPRAGFVWDGANTIWYCGPRYFAFDGAPDQTKKGGCEYARGMLDPGDSYVAPLYHEGLVYHMGMGGVLAVGDAASAKILYSKMLDLSPWFSHWTFGCSSSPTLGGSHVFIMDNQLNVVVLKPGREYRQVALNRIDNFLPRREAERWQDSPMSNPVFDADCIYIRGERDLFCIGATP
ncbi:MAG: PQQ-like beta-propeller repeat protein [Planctomycetota bacterium]|nr:PQQ-like beta-propeller repeat protein [Planctomycetota bacterium]